MGRRKVFDTESARQGDCSTISIFRVPLGWVLSDNFRVDHFPTSRFSGLQLVSLTVLQFYQKSSRHIEKKKHNQSWLSCG